MYLIDTNVISEARKVRANPGVVAFFDAVDVANEPINLSAIIVSEFADRIRYRSCSGGCLRVPNPSNALEKQIGLAPINSGAASIAVASTRRIDKAHRL